MLFALATYLLGRPYMECTWLARIDPVENVLWSGGPKDGLRLQPPRRPYKCDLARPLDQSPPAHQTLLWRFPRRGEDPNLDRREPILNQLKLLESLNRDGKF